jgi:hypothetical protein
MLPTQLFTPPTTPLTSSPSQSVSQLAEFASSMVYLMWHARKTTQVLSERSYSPSLVGNDLAHLMWQARRKPMNKYSPLGDHSFSYTASPAFKKFCYQVSSVID